MEEYKDVVAIERTREFKGRYHVLGGAISPIDGIGPDQLRIRELMSRLTDTQINEIILATDPNLEGRRPHLPDPAAQPVRSSGDEAGQRPARGRRLGVRRRGHARAGVRRAKDGGMNGHSGGRRTQA